MTIRFLKFRSSEEMFTSFGFKPWGGVGGGLVTFTQSVLSICQVIGFFLKGAEKGCPEGGP